MSQGLLEGGESSGTEECQHSKSIPPLIYTQKLGLKSILGPDECFQMLMRAKKSQDISNYLIYILRRLSSTTRYPREALNLIRSAAAITLKNHVRDSYRSIPAAQLTYIRSSIVECLEDPNPQIRSYAGSVITELVQQVGILGWPGIIPELLTLAANEKGNVPPSTQEGAMGALSKICEDSIGALDKDYQGQRPSDIMLPKLLQLTCSPLPDVRALALHSVNHFIPHKPRALQQLVDPFLQQLLKLAADPSEEVRIEICEAFCNLVDICPEKIIPYMEPLVNYMISQQRNQENAELARNAAEFWLAVGEHKTMWSSLGPYLPLIVPTLLECMVYSDEDVDRLEGRHAEDAHQDDKIEDLKPLHAQNKAARTTVKGTLTNGISSKSVEETEEGEISEDDEEGDENPEENWNLRKCSAAALDVLATNFHEAVFEITLPYLKDNLGHGDWPRREAAVLAIGAVADGCMDVVQPHLPELVPYLISLLRDPQPDVRTITCWALGRYSKWGAFLEKPEDKAQYFEPMIEGVLQRMLDGNKSVQEAAASAFSTMEEKAKNKMAPYCKPILQTFVRCFQVYKDRNMVILYDCVQTLAEHVGPTLAQPELMDLLMPALLLRWAKLYDRSRELFSLLECLSYVASSLGDFFSPYAPQIFSRCVKIIHENLKDHIAASENPLLDQPDKDFVVISLDLLSSIIQGLPSEKSQELVRTSQPGLFDLLQFCMEDEIYDVRQSSYALLGDCAIQVFPQLQPFLKGLMPYLIKQLEIDDILDEDSEKAFSVVNNACWSCGEIAMQEKTDLEAYIQELYSRLLNIISNPDVPTSVNENAAIAVGRLGLHYAQGLAPHLGEFADHFLRVMEPVALQDEKRQAFHGFNKIIILNPRTMESCLLEYFTATAAFSRNDFRDPDLYTSFKTVRVPADPSKRIRI